MKGFFDVLAFQYKFGVLPEHGVPHLPPRSVTDYRIRFLQEELDELAQSIENDDLSASVDALIDLVYVAYGTALLMGINPKCWEECWGEVQRANMEKERATSSGDPRSKRAHELDVVKPEGWRGPEHEDILKSHGAKELEK